MTKDEWAKGLFETGPDCTDMINLVLHQIRAEALQPGADQTTVNVLKSAFGIDVMVGKDEPIEE